ncbi:MAG: RluA family pseudouridine synthase [Rhodothalassiaceae bacterium]
MSGVSHREVDAGDEGIRLDRWFARHYPGLGHSALAKLLRTGQVRIDGRRARAGDRVAAGQTIRIPPLDPSAFTSPSARPRQAEPTNADIAEMRAMVLYEDEDVIALDKPPGLATQGGPGIARHVDGLLEALRARGGERPKLVHRLDKDTSGLLLVARTARAAAHLAAAFKARETRKIYWALVMGVPALRNGKIVAPMEKLPDPKGERMIVTDSGKPARTLYATIAHAGRRAAWLALRPLTGRTHQLRLHCAHMGHPIVGDGKYGGSDAMLGGSVSRKLHLHARRLVIPHPDGRRLLDLTAPLPEHMRASWAMFEWDETLSDDPFPED